MDTEWLGCKVVLVGVGATLFMDVWLAGLKRLGVPTLNFALLGRWVGHGLRGRWRHASIAQAASLRGERALGWAAHYGVGVAFSIALAVVAGPEWLAQPDPALALAFGVATAVAPLLVMQPAMGLGVAASRTATPLRNVSRSLANHAVFGLGLYLAARLVAGLGA